MAESLRLVDTSVILRYLTGDIRELASRARALIDSETPLGITAVALLEAAYVLRRTPYNRPREAVVDVLIELLQRENVQGVGVEKEQAAVALLLCRPSGAVSFGDALIAATGRSVNVTEAYSFDEQFGRSGITVVPIPAIGETDDDDSERNEVI